MAALATSAFQPGHARRGFDAPLFLRPRQRLTRAEQRAAASARPRGLLLSFRGEVRPWVQPWWQARDEAESCAKISRVICARAVHGSV